MTIHELLELTPEQLQAIPDAQLKVILTPVFPLVRTPILPEEKPRKTSNQDKLITQLLADNADKIAALRKARQV